MYISNMYELGKMVEYVYIPQKDRQERTRKRRNRRNSCQSLKGSNIDRSKALPHIKI